MAAAAEQLATPCAAMAALNSALRRGLQGMSTMESKLELSDMRFFGQRGVVYDEFIVSNFAH
jgi:hypothetical protein